MKKSAVRGKTRNVVINVCFGGFGLSPAAVRRLAEIAGRPCFFFVKDLLGAGRGFGPYRQVSDKEAEKAFIWHAFDIPNPETLDDDDRWHEMTMDERKAYNEKYATHVLYERDIARDDPRLVQVVKELGTKKASGSLAELKIVKIPADAEWHIHEYDGTEYVAENHRTWP